MAKKEIKDIVESIRARLKNFARRSGRDFDAVLLQYFQERLLYRVSVSEFNENFILKGALLLMVKSVSPFRPTKDIDFLGKGIKAEPESLKILVRKISKIDCNDGIQFISESVKAAAIKEGAEYEGIRVKIDSTLGKIKKTITVDIGFGDKIFDGPEEFDFPVLLDFPAPKIKCYNYETIIAEKFQAIVWLNFQTSRLKDFFDILFLAENNAFQAYRLKNAIIETFKRRNTEIEQRRTVFSDEFKNDPSKQIQWTAFLKKNNLTAEFDFKVVIENIEKFLEPLFSGNPTEDNIWNKYKW
ncbi:MAG: nucleotidyl transferase AbiEii/AbiGii toxin family protein [Candidatus Aminicenantes bacterium]|nr:MAG: nucleotidyl transferase AbiEii/AbiGii toxin family protein [Candidatus Aminicenantes bacterium]